jgi:oxygen-independent coproporphyrinogen-3 oxidase
MGALNFEIEYLTEANRYNEYMMTQLRRLEGFDLDFVKTHFGNSYFEHTLQVMDTMRTKHYFMQVGNRFTLTKEAKFLADGIASDFFILTMAQ